VELWLTQKSTIFALIDMSESNTPLSDESVDAMYRVKAREKMMKLAELSFYGSLELELFSGFDLKGTETILDLQGRIFEDFMPHFDNDKSNLTALLDVMQANVHGRHVACYRYLCCEVFAAEVFERFTDAIVSNPQLFPQLRLEMRQRLLEPGAAIDFDGFQSKFGLKGCTLDPLWKLHGIANVLFVAPSES
jgi:Zn-dependent oligopeptidase